MAVPTFVGVTGGTVGPSPINVGMPPGWAAGDLLLTFVETSNFDANTPAGWAVVPNTPARGPTNGGGQPWFDPNGNLAARLFAFWRIAQAGDAGVAINVPGAAGAVWMAAFRGVDPVNPFGFSSGGPPGSGNGVVGAPNNFPLAFPAGAGPGEPLYVGAVGVTGAASVAAYANASLAGITERLDFTGGAGARCGALITATQPVPGAFGATTCTVSTGNGWGVAITLELQPPGRPSVFPRHW